VRRVGKVSNWVFRMCRNGVLKSVMFSVLTICVQHYTKIRTGNDKSHILEGIKVRGEWNSCRCGCPTCADMGDLADFNGAWHVESLFFTVSQAYESKTSDRGIDACLMYNDLDMLPIWVSKMYQNGVLKSQSLKMFGVSRACFHGWFSIWIQMPDR
jgi:hypothetical protein